MAPFDDMKDIYDVPSTPFPNQRVCFTGKKTLPTIQPRLRKVLTMTREKYRYTMKSIRDMAIELTVIEGALIQW